MIIMTRFSIQLIWKKNKNRYKFLIILKFFSHMDINYRVNIGKWLPLPSDVLEKWFADSSMLTKRMDNFVENIALIIRNIADAQTYDIKVYSGIANNLEEMKEEYKSISTTSLSAHPIYNYKMRHFLMTLKRKLNVLARFTRNLINEIVDCKSDELLRIIFRWKSCNILIFD